MATLRVSEVFRARLREVRSRRRWSQSELAKRMNDAGYPMSRAKIGKLETMQPVDVDDLFALCAVLSVSPLSMIVPLDEQDRIAVVPSLVVDPQHVRQWVRYLNPLDASWKGPEDWRIYATEIPDVDHAAAMREGLAERERILAGLPEDIAELTAALADSRSTRAGETSKKRIAQLDQVIEDAEQVIAYKQAMLRTGEVPLPMTQHYLTREDA